MLNYIPYIGVAIMVAVLFLIGLFTFPTTSEAIIALIYVAITTIEGHFSTPAPHGLAHDHEPLRGVSGHRLLDLDVGSIMAPS